MYRCYILKYYDFRRDKINISDLCRKCDISRGTFYNIINNISEPSVSVALKITKYLDRQLVLQGYQSGVYPIDVLFRY